MWVACLQVILVCITAQTSEVLGFYSWNHVSQDFYSKNNEYHEC